MAHLQESAEESWFAPQTAKRLHDLFQSLDSRCCGRLGHQDLITCVPKRFLVQALFQSRSSFIVTPSAVMQQAQCCWQC